jgi:hypothetical protein
VDLERATGIEPATLSLGSSEGSRDLRQKWLSLLKVEPGLDSLRDDPRFDEWVKRVERIWSGRRGSTVLMELTPQDFMAVCLAAGSEAA